MLTADERIFFHRSWTGAKIYEAQIKKTNSCYAISNIMVERDSKIYSNENVDEDIGIFNFLVGRGLLGLNVIPPIESDELGALKGWSNFGQMMF